MEKIKTKILIVFCTMFLITGCGGALDENDPVSVARAFWTAALSKTPQDAKQFTSEPGVKFETGIKGTSKNDTFFLKDVDQQDGFYFVNTTLRLERNGSAISVPLRTVIVPVNGKWKVDYYSTKQSIIDETLHRSMDYYKNTTAQASKYFDDILGVSEADDVMANISTRLDEDFAHAKKLILENYKKSLKIKSK